MNHEKVSLLQKMGGVPDTNQEDTQWGFWTAL